MTYLTRTVAPDRIRKAAKIFDRWVTEAYLNKHDFQDANLSSSMYDQLSLPLHRGGMGLRRHEDTCIYAYLGAAARAVQRFNIIHPNHETHQLKLSQSSSYATHLTATIDEISFRHPSLSSSTAPNSSLIPSQNSISSIINYYSWSANNTESNGHQLVPHLQTALTKIYTQSLYTRITSGSSLSTRDRPDLISGTIQLLETNCIAPELCYKKQS